MCSSLNARGTPTSFQRRILANRLSAPNLTNFDLGDDVYAGLFVCSHDADVIEKAIFRDVRIIRPVKEGFVPYKDYIGSVLEILDVHNGKLEKIYESAQPFEAPNWTRDGGSLIYNISGRAEGWGQLNRFDLSTGNRRHSTPTRTTETTMIMCCRSTERCWASATKARTTADNPAFSRCHPRAARPGGSRR